MKTFDFRPLVIIKFDYVGARFNKKILMRGGDFQYFWSISDFVVWQYKQFCLANGIEIVAFPYYDLYGQWISTKPSV